MDTGIATILISTAVSTVTVGIALATLMVRLIRGLARSLEKADRHAAWTDVRELRREQAGLRDRVSRIEGLLEGLREAITGRHAAAD